MNYTQEEQLRIQGFRNGYFIASKNKALQDKIMKLDHDKSYLNGFIKGIAEYERHLEVTSPAMNKLEQRRAKLRQIADQEKDREQNEHER